MGDEYNQIRLEFNGSEIRGSKNIQEVMGGMGYHNPVFGASRKDDGDWVSSLRMDSDGTIKDIQSETPRILRELNSNSLGRNITGIMFGNRKLIATMEVAV